jgi:multicomponent Na+:H+ antiporter subunit E
MNPSPRFIVIYKAIAFFGAWVLLSDSFAPVHLALGCVVSLGVALLNTPTTQSPYLGIRWSGLFIYIPWLLVCVLRSGMHLSLLILDPRLPIDPKLLRYRTTLQHDAGVVLLGNSITLTPGTITADVNSGELVVHAIDDASADDLTSLKMERKIATAFGLSGKQQ